MLFRSTIRKLDLDALPRIGKLRPGLPVQPPTLFVNKAPIDSELHGTLTWGAAQAGVAAGVADAVAKGDRDGLGKLLGEALEPMKAQGIPLISFWRAPAVAIYRVHAPKVFDDDASARRSTVRMRCSPPRGGRRRRSPRTLQRSL